MAKTFHQIVQEEMGGLHLKVLELTVVNLQLKERNEQLEAELVALKGKTE